MSVSVVGAAVSVSVGVVGSSVSGTGAAVSVSVGVRSQATVRVAEAAPSMGTSCAPSMVSAVKV